MNKKIHYLIISFLFIIISGCKDDDTNNAPDPLKVRNYIWNGLNEFYLWQESTANLADDKFSDQNSMNQFLNQFSSPKDLFYNLLNDYPNTDRFSWITDNYYELGNAVQNNIFGTNGIEFGLIPLSRNNNRLVGFVKYIIPNSDADNKGIERGDLFYAVNDIELTTNNYNILFSDSYTLNFASVNHNNYLNPNGVNIKLEKTEIQENPIHVSKIFDFENKKIGYLMYNSFSSGFDNNLNNEFGKFQSENIDHLILDLRYNSGGSVNSAIRLASMITGQFTNQLFTIERWNEKITKKHDFSLENNFITTFDQTSINHTRLNEITVITSSNTASASELIINCLKPYINVKVIGDQTVGKIHGSITLYDSPDFSNKNINPDHTYAMQPLVLEITNKNNENYPLGIIPDIPIIENVLNLGVLGDEQEPLLNKALSEITNTVARVEEEIAPLGLKEFKTDRSISPIRDNMYVNY